MSDLRAALKDAKECLSFSLVVDFTIGVTTAFYLAYLFFLHPFIKGPISTPMEFVIVTGVCSAVIIGGLRIRKM